jgi:cytochrome P450
MFDGDFIRNPYPTYTRLRESGPLHWIPDFGPGVWLIPRYDDVASAMQDSRLSAKRGHRYVAQYPAERQAELADFNRLFAMWVLFLDPPRHTVWRRLMNRGLAAVTPAQLRPRIAALVNRLIDGVFASGRMDFIRDVAHPLPALIILDLLGVRVEDQQQVIEWTDDIAKFFGNARSPIEVAHKARTALFSLSEYFMRILEERRANPGDDLISVLLQAEDGDNAVTSEELAAQCSCLLFGGHETGRNLIGNGLHALLKCPEQLDLLRRDPSLIASAVKELLRYDTPAQMGSRVVAESFELYGSELKAGQIVITLFGSANRDPVKFTNPDMLDIRRKEAPTLSFGKGSHFCVGAALTMLEAEVTLSAALERMPNVRLADTELEWVNNINFRGLQSLPLLF